MDSFKSKVALIALTAMNVANCEGQDFRPDELAAYQMVDHDAALYTIEQETFELGLVKLLKDSAKPALKEARVVHHSRNLNDNEPAWWEQEPEFANALSEDENSLSSLLSDSDNQVGALSEGDAQLGAIDVYEYATATVRRGGKSKEEEKKGGSKGTRDCGPGGSHEGHSHCDDVEGGVGAEEEKKGGSKKSKDCSPGGSHFGHSHCDDVEGGVGAEEEKKGGSKKSKDCSPGGSHYGHSHCDEDGVAGEETKSQKSSKDCGIGGSHYGHSHCDEVVEEINEEIEVLEPEELEPVTVEEEETEEVEVEVETVEEEEELVVDCTGMISAYNELILQGR